MKTEIVRNVRKILIAREILSKITSTPPPPPPRFATREPENLIYMVSCVIVGFVLVPVLVEVSDIILNPYLRHSDLVDLRIFMNVFNMIVLAYIFKSTFDSLIRKADIKLLCVPAAFELLWLEQLLLLMTYFDGGSHTFISSIVARLAGHNSICSHLILHLQPRYILGPMVSLLLPVHKSGSAIHSLELEDKSLP
jgi:hypothetical protein